MVEYTFDRGERACGTALSYRLKVASESGHGVRPIMHTVRVCPCFYNSSSLKNACCFSVQQNGIAVSFVHALKLKRPLNCEHDWVVLQYLRASMMMD
jgi:hypothetical protein